MDNEEKARELANRWSTDSAYSRAKISALEMAEWKDEQFKEEFGLIIEWFDHIAQIADNRKTLNGFVMQDSDALDEIKCLAKTCSEYISML